MRPHPRIRKTVKKGGVVLLLLLFVAWIGSAFLSLSWTGDIPYLPGRVTIGIGGGALAWTELTDQAVIKKYVPAGWDACWGPGLVNWRGPFMRATPTAGTNKIWEVGVPLWQPLLVLLPIVALAWHLDLTALRRARAGHCPKCNYDLSGLPPGTPCPECGKAAATLPS